MIKLYMYGLLLIIGMNCLTACTVVEPWDRNYLAEESMKPYPDHLGAYMKYKINSDREGTRGASGINAGGCGCN
jgi:hypothetical protein